MWGNYFNAPSFLQAKMHRMLAFKRTDLANNLKIQKIEMTFRRRAKFIYLFFITDSSLLAIWAYTTMMQIDFFMIYIHTYQHLH